MDKEMLEIRENIIFREKVMTEIFKVNDRPSYDEIHEITLEGKLVNVKLERNGDVVIDDGDCITTYTLRGDKKVEMKMINKLRNELIDFEGDFLELDNKMVELGFYSVAEDGEETVEGCLEDLVAYYLLVEDNETQVQIEFDTKILANDTEWISASNIKVKSVELF